MGDWPVVIAEIVLGPLAVAAALLGAHLADKED